MIGRLLCRVGLHRWVKEDRQLPRRRPLVEWSRVLAVWRIQHREATRVSEKVVTGTGWDIWAKVPWTVATLKMRLLPGGGIEVRWTEPDTEGEPT